MIHNERVPLFVGCTKRNLCFEVERMPKTARYFTTAPRQGHMRQLAGEEIQGYGREAQLAAFEVTQRIPEGLAYRTDSAVPAAEVDLVGERTVLRWSFLGADASAPQTVTYAVEPVSEGNWDITGLMTFTDASELQRSLPVPPRAITVAGLCDPLVPTDTPTATPRPPTETPVPTATASATQTATATPEPQPLFLPVALRFTCKPDERLGDIVLVLDMSTSMERLTPDGVTKREAALDAARTFVARLDFTANELGQHDQVAIVGFNDEAWVEQGMTCDPAAVEAALGGIQDRQAPGTRLDLAFEQGLAALDPERCKPGNKPVIILLTDGMPSLVPPHPETGRMEETVIDAAARAKAAGATIYTIGFGSADESADPGDRVNPWLLEQCASDADKSFIDPRADRLREIYNQIADVFTCPPLSWP